MPKPDASSAPRDNLFLNLAFNLIIPILLLSKGKDWFGLDARVNLVIALLFPIGYGLRDIVFKRKVNFFSILGIVSTALKGGLGLVGANPFWVAVNEAAIPGIFAVATFLSLLTQRPLARALLFNPDVFKTSFVEEKLDSREKRSAFERLLKNCSLWIGLSFLISAALNYFVARHFVVTDPSVDLDQFNREIGAMQGWSFVIILVPSMAMFLFAVVRLFKGIKTLTGLDLEEVLVNDKKKEPAEGSA